MNERATINVVAFAGSLRQESYNRALLRAAQESAPESMSIDTFDLSPIPLYNYDVEQQGDPEPVQEFKDAIRKADALLIATPEYQHGIPGVLKNALDWASRPPKQSPLQGKPAAIMGATPGMTGTARAQTQLRQTLVYNSMYAVMSPEVLVADAKEKFDEELRLIDKETKEFIRQLLENLTDLTLMLRRHKERIG